MDHLYSIEVAGVRLPCALEFPELAPKLCATPLNSASCSAVPISIPAAHWRFYEEAGLPHNPYGEHSALASYYSEALLPYDRMLFHSVAVRWRDRAYLISAPSGVGKSTQAKYLQALRPGEFSIICGDRPALEFCRAPSDASADPASVSDCSVTVHPSPWNGKEGWHGAPAAPLGGIVFLVRGKKNSVIPLTAKQAAVAAYIQFIHTATREDVVRRGAEMLSQMLPTVPLWGMTTCTVPDSTRLLLETVFSASDSSQGRS